MTDLFMLAAAGVQVPDDFDSYWVTQVCCIMATVAAAISGATASSRVRMDIFGIICCGTIVAMGGGTVRDLMLTGLVRPDGKLLSVYWVTEPDVYLLYYAIITSFLVFYITRFIKAPVGTIRVADALSMAFFTMLGTAKACYFDCPWLVCVTMGVFTGIAGGVMRDVLTGNVPYVFRPGELYATTSVIGSLAFLVLSYFQVPYGPAFLLAVLVTVAIRMGSVYLNWKLPSYRPLFDHHRHSQKGVEEEK